MRFRILLFCTSLLLTIFHLQPVLAQTPSEAIPLELQGNRARIPFDLSSQRTLVELRNLVPGNTYLIIAIPAEQHSDRLQLELYNKYEEAASVLISNPARPQSRRWQATASTVMLVVEKPIGSTLSNAAYLSVACESCPAESNWIDKFMGQADAVISTTGGISASSLVTNTLIGGNCFDVANITSSGAANSRGTFNNGSTSIGINTGVVLCTGNVNVIPGPNTSSSSSGNTAGFNVNTADDPDLATLTAGNQWDVSRIEFDFTPTAENVQFDFVFGSEEYCEYVGTNFNDVFGFFISGPGISGNQNIALLPGSTTPVSINNVNHTTNTTYYINNNTFNACGGLGAAAVGDIALDGYTTILTATAELIPCETYHIKLAIADVADGSWASAVFLKANSFEAGGNAKALPIYPAGAQFVYEGNCGGGGFIRFVRGSGDINVPLVIDYTVSPNSTATVGLDYAPLPNPITIPAGQTEILIPVTVFSDLIIEGNESIILVLDQACTCTQQEVEFIIAEVPPLEIEMDDITICGTGNATLSPNIVSPGVPNYTYNWSTGATTPSISVNTPGTTTYTVTVTDNCNTTATAQATVNLTPAPTATLTGSGTLCVGTTGSFNLTITFTGIAPWEVEWNGNTETFTSSPATVTVTDPGTYTLTSVSSNDCPGTVSGSAVITEVEVDLNLNGTDPTCNGISNGSITSSVSGGTAPYNYTWSPTGTGANPTNLPAGTYNVTVTSRQGCTDEAEITLEEPDPLTVSVTAPNIDCNNPTSQSEVTVEGGTPNYTYNWSNSSNSSNPTFNAGGTYTVTVSDSKNCTATASVTVAANLTLPVAVANVTGQINCLNEEITLNGNGSSVGPQFTYEWSGPGLVAGETTLNPTVNAAGSYTLTVTNTDNGCTKTVSVSVVENTTPPNAVIAPPQNIGCNSPTVSVNATGSSSGAPFTFVWSTVGGNFTGGTNTLTPTVNQEGTYTILVTNTQNGCTNEASVTITGNTIPPVAVINPPITITCDDPTIEIDASGSSSGGGFTYSWSGPPGGINSGGNSLNPTVDVGGTYVLTITDSQNGCTTTASVTVNQNNTPPVAVANFTGTITCQTPTININGAGSSTGPVFTYEWSTNNGNIVSGENTLFPTVNQGGTYTLTVTNTENGCTKTVSVTVPSNNDVPLANAGNPATLTCTTTSITLGGSGTTGPNITYQWTAIPGNIVSGATTLNPTINQPGCYQLQVTNTANQCSATDVVCIEQDVELPDAIISPPIQLTCNDPSFDLDASASTQGPGINYSWSGPPGGINSGGNTLTPTIDLPGQYTLTVTNSNNGCTDVATVTVTQNNTPPVAEAGPGGELDCVMPTATLSGLGSSVGGQFSYEWNTINGNFQFGENTLFPVVDEPGTYTLVVTNNLNGCTASDQVVITADQNIPNANAGNNRDLNCNNLTVVLNGSATPAGLTYNWLTSDGNIVSGANTLSPTVNQEGTYTLIITNPNNGCTDEDEVFVTNNISIPTAVVAPPGQINCNSEWVDLDATASEPGFNGDNLNFQWSGIPSNGIQSGSSGPTPVIVEPGIYTVTVQNASSQCTSTATVVVTEDVTPPTAVASATGILTCQFPTVGLTGFGSSTGFQYFYEWTTLDGNIVSGENGLSPTVNQIGTYTLTVFNSETGCTSEAVAIVTTNQTFPTAIAGAPQVITCTNAQVNLNGTGSSAGNQYSYVWNTVNGNIVAGGNTLTPTVNQPGTYELSVVNTQTGCTSTASVNVSINTTNPAAIAAPGGILSCTVPSLTLNGNGSSTGSAFSYSWQTSNGNILSGANSLQPTVNAVGLYTLVVTNQENGCTATTSTSVQADANLPISSAGAPDTLNCYDPVLILNGAGSSSGAGIAYQWSGPGIVSGAQSLTPSVNQPGTYQLLVTNSSNGCTALSNVLISDLSSPPAATAGVAATLTCAQPTLTLNGAGSAQGAGISYLWSTTNGQILNGATSLTPVINQPGTYQLQVTNTLTGCSAQDQVSIDQNTQLPEAEAGAEQLIDCITPQVTLNGSSNGAPQLLYQWSTPNGNIATGSNSLSPVVDAPGDYYFTVTDSTNGCIAIDSVIVLKDANVPIATVVTPGNLNCVTTSLQLNGLNSSPGLEYSWNTNNGNIVSGGATLTPLVNLPGQYQLVVFNPNNNCTALSTVTVLIDTIYPVADAGAPAILSCLNPILQLNGSGSSQGPFFTYLWTTTDGNILSGASTLTPSVDESGFYQLLVTNSSNGCTQAETVQILLDQNTPEADAGANQLLTCSTSQLQLNGTGSTQGPNFSMQWTGPGILSGNTSLTPTVNLPGTYELLVSNALNGCTSLAQVTVNQDTLAPILSTAPPAILNCQLVSTQLQAIASGTSPNLGYSWTANSGGNILNGAQTATPTINTPGTYEVTVTNLQTGCTSSAITTVQQDISTPIANAGSDAELNCTIPTFVLSGSGSNLGNNFSVNWSGTGNIVSGVTSFNPIINAPGTYTLLITNTDNFCTSTDQVLITQNVNAPVAAVLAPATLTCAVTSIELNGSGSSSGSNFTYSWSTPNGTIGGASNQSVTSATAPGTYVLEVTNTSNNCKSLATVVVPQDINPPTAVGGAPVTLTCAATSIQLNGQGSSAGPGFSYQWSVPSGSNGNLIGGSTTLTPIANAPGLYQLVVTNASNGCTSSTTAQVLQDLNAPAAGGSAPAELTCTVQSITLQGTGSQGPAFTYQWSTFSGNILSGGTTLSPVVDAPGNYTLKVTNLDNGCQTLAVVQVTENIQAPTLSAGADNLLTCANTQLTLSGTASGGNAGISLLWNGPGIVSGNTTLSPTINQPGVYQLTATDNYNGCTASDVVQITADTQLPVVQIASPALLTCLVTETNLQTNGSSQGSQFNYQWSGPGIVGSSNVPNPLVNQPGAYQLVISNSINGCTSLGSVQVPQDIQLPIAEANNGFELTCSVESGFLSAQGSSTGSLFSYLWSTADGQILQGTTSSAPEVVQEGTYQLRVTNTQTGCFNTDNVVVTRNTNYPSALLVDTQRPACGGQPGSIDIQEVTGGEGPYVYSINGGNTFFPANQFSNLSPGTYDLLVQDANGCEYGESLTFPVPVEPQVNTTPQISLEFGESDQLIASLNIPISQVASITWTPQELVTPTTQPNVVVVRPFQTTTFEVTIVNLDGCESRSLTLVQVSDPAVYAPNVITPSNQQDNNDIFTIFAKEGHVRKIKTLQIYDRWGNMVFQTTNVLPNDRSKGWDGRYKGEMMNPAVFVWWAEIELESGEEILLEGDVTIAN